MPRTRRKALRRPACCTQIVVPDAVLDPALRDLADNLNTMVADVQAREKRNSDKDRRLRIGFLVTGSGFLPVWKIVLNDTDTYGSEADTADLEAMTDEQRDGYLRLAAQ